ncbi:MAG: pyridoxal 5'-phosphate synthase glutaminase subunit PdxT [Actinobacteria bacterium HGW-Actinobacteria-6]|nr:MAG: pyridoxal 5'-phosphate synthase glutaminase subunit PdxT [Actinobacteria bacterium HGW-Actinobacteria-6]
MGVLALQGAFREHIVTLEALGASGVAVRLPEQLGDLSGLIIPGGESSAIGKLMRTYGFYDAIRQQHGAGMAVWGTCAGAILMATEVLDALPDQEALGLMDIAIRRNAYGRQVDSFEADLDVSGVDDGTFRGVFIRAPWIESVGDGVEVLARHDGHIVAACQADLMATTFHPELTGDPRLHRYFLDSVVGA